MLFKLEHHVVWHMVMDVLEEHPMSVFTGHWKMDAVYPDQNRGTHQSDYMFL
jgi:hypothetical protein